jgi:hypothetical protein
MESSLTMVLVGCCQELILVSEMTLHFLELSEFRKLYLPSQEYAHFIHHPFFNRTLY